MIEKRVLGNRFFRTLPSLPFLRGLDYVQIVQREIGNGQLKRTPVQQCMLCSGTDFFQIASRDKYGFDVSQLLCRNCSLIQASPIMEDASLETFYEQHYRLMKEGVPADVGFKRRFERQLRNGKKIVKRLSPHAKDPRQCRVAEIGCGAGGIVKVLIEAGFQASGFDIDNTYLSLGIEKYQLPLYQRLFTPNEGQFDIVVLRHVLEHLKNPRELIRSIQKTLTPDGLLYIEVPGLRSLFNGKYEFNLLDFFVLEHLYVFELGTLAQLLSQSKFGMIEGDESVYAIFRYNAVLQPHPFQTGEPLLRELEKLETTYLRKLIPGKIKSLKKQTKSYLKKLIKSRTP